MYVCIVVDKLYIGGYSDRCMYLLQQEDVLIDCSDRVIYLKVLIQLGIFNQFFVRNE